MTAAYQGIRVSVGRADALGRGEGSALLRESGIDRNRVAYCLLPIAYWEAAGSGVASGD